MAGEFEIDDKDYDENEHEVLDSYQDNYGNTTRRLVRSRNPNVKLKIEEAEEEEAVPTREKKKVEQSKNVEAAEPKSKYKIKKGDTLWDISRATGMSIDDIMKRNGIKDKNKIYAGQELDIDGYDKLETEKYQRTRDRRLAQWKKNNDTIKATAENNAAMAKGRTPTYDTSNQDGRTIFDAINKINR